MTTLLNLLRVAFYSGFVSCGLAVLNHIKLKLLPYIYFCAFCASFVFNGLNLVTDTIIAGFAAGFVAAVLVGIFHRMEKHGYIAIVIPVIYCMGPGGALYKMFLAIMNSDFAAAGTQLDYILRDAVGLWLGILFATELMNRITGKKSEEF